MKRFIYVLMMVMVFGFMASGASAAGKVEVKQRFYSGSGDGYIGGKTADDPAWNAHDYSSASSFTTPFVSYTDTNNIFGACVGNDTGARFFITRSFYPINTIIIPDNAIVLSGTFNFFVNSKYNYYSSDSESYLGLVQTSQANLLSLSSDDFDQCGIIDNPVEGADGIAIANLLTGSYNSFILNQDALGWINVNGYTKLGIREGHDIKDVSLPDVVYSGNRNYVDIFFSEEVGTDKDPYLEVIYICNDIDAPLVGGDVISVTPITYVEVVEKFYPIIDGSIMSSDQSPWSSWSVIRDAVGMDLYIDSAPDIGICVRMATGQTSNTYTDIRRGEYIFDASSIPDYATATAGKFSLYGESKYDNNSYLPIIEIVSSNPASETVLAASVVDFTSFGNTRLATGISFNDWSISGYNDFILNESGITNISVTGKSKFGTIANYDLDGTAPAAPGSEKTYDIRAYMTGHIGTDQDPYLEVTYRCKQSDAPSVGGNVISVTEVIEESIGQATSINGDIIQCVGISDINSNGSPEIVVLGNDVNGDPIVCKIDAGTGDLIGDVSFHSSGWVAKSITTVPDQNGNGVEEISVLAINPSAGDVETEMKDASTNAVVGGVILP